MPDAGDELTLERPVPPRSAADRDAGTGTSGGAGTGTGNDAGARARARARPPILHASWRAVRRVRVRTWLAPLIAFAVFAAAWEIYASSHPYVLPTIGAIWNSITLNSGMYWANFVIILKEVAIGAAAGIAAAFLLAVLMTEVPIFEAALMPLMVTLMVTPIVAIAPALVIIFGFGEMPKYIVTGLVVFFPMLVNSVAGLQDVDGRTLEVFTTLHASRWEVFRHLRLPGSMPFVFTGLRIALPLSVVGATVAEFSVAGQANGLAALIEAASSQSNISVVWSGIVLLALLGVALVAVLALIRRRVLWWDNQASLRDGGGSGRGR